MDQNYGNKIIHRHDCVITNYKKSITKRSVEVQTGLPHVDKGIKRGCKFVFDITFLMMKLLISSINYDAILVMIITYESFPQAEAR